MKLGSAWAPDITRLRRILETTVTRNKANRNELHALVTGNVKNVKNFRKFAKITTQYVKICKTYKTCKTCNTRQKCLKMSQNFIECSKIARKERV